MIEEYYRVNDIVFVVVTGMKQSGKSLLCDTILNLCGTKGNHVRTVLFSTINQINSGIILGQTPLSKTNSGFI